MAFNPPGQRQTLLTSIPGFSTISHNRPNIHQNSPSPASIHPAQSNLSAARASAIGLNHFGNTTGMAVGHLPSSHSQNQQQISNQQENSLDPSDFPALGAGPPSSTNLSHNALSYASHVNASAANGLSGDRSVAATNAGQRTDFTADDFPALDTSASQQQQQHQQQQATEAAAREAREQASAAAALTAQMARLNVQNKSAPISESDNRNFAHKPLAGSNPAFHGSVVGGSTHLSNGVGGNQASHHQLKSHSSSHLTPQSGTVQAPSNPHLHSTLPSPIPPNLTSHRPSNLGNYPSNVALSNVSNTLAQTPASQNQSIQELGGAASGAENRSGGSDPSSQPTPLLDYAASLDSISQNANCNSSVVPFFAPQTPAEQVLFGPADRFGLMNLLHIIRHADADYSMLAMGKDLTHLGLDLGSSEALYPKFMTPWSDAKQVASHAIEPEFTLPACYHVQPQPVQTKLPQFHEETLFFIFYSQPRDLMQELAALELYKKNWRYHKELQLWLTKESGTGPMEKTPHYERGFYVFFDPVIWKRVTKEFVLQYDQLEAKPALATNPAALQAATQLSLVYTSNGPHGKNSLSSTTTNPQQQPSQPAQQEQQQHQLRSSNNNPNHLIVPNNIPPNLVPV